MSCLKIAMVGPILSAQNIHLVSIHQVLQTWLPQDFHASYIDTDSFSYSMNFPFSFMDLYLAYIIFSDIPALL